MSGERATTAALVVAAAALTAAATVQALPPARTASRGPLVQSMIVGANGQIVFSPPDRCPRAPRPCGWAGRAVRVAAGTPLAVLAAVRRAGGPPFAVRDYGRCGASPVNSGQLFVYSLAKESNRGQDGWEYKVDDVAGSTGAGDPSGPNGDGRRLRAGERVLWFWCRAMGGGCERTLAVAPAVSTVSPGGSLAVTVTGYDDEGHGAPIAGAIVTLGSDFASTEAGGRATLIAPTTPGVYKLSARQQARLPAALVPSFPETLVVR